MINFFDTPLLFAVLMLASSSSFIALAVIALWKWARGEG